MQRELGLRFVSILRLILLFAVSVAFVAIAPDILAQEAGSAVVGNSMPGDWRPFSSDSPWNTPIAADVDTHPESDQIMATLESEASHLRFSNSYTPPLWVVDANDVTMKLADAKYPFDAWDTNLDRLTEAGAPVTDTMYGEPTSDGHIIIIDPVRGFAWEMSYFRGLRENGLIDCSTFNIWDLDGTGVGDANEGTRWRSRGGRGSGFPIIAGLIRPEELSEGEIRHALVFTFNENRGGVHLPPAARSDGKHSGSQYPIEGMRFQLDPSLTETDFDAWGLNREGKIVARALQKYGMLDGDNGGAMALQVQLLGPTKEENRAEWDRRFPDFYRNIRKIPTDRFRAVYTGEPVTGGAKSTVVQPLVLPLGGTILDGQRITITTATRGAYITYTLDGSTPTESSRRYESPFGVDRPTTIRARAFAIGKTPSPVTRAPFGSDGATPAGPSTPEAPVPTAESCD
jgi:hypothetical protein